ncbi:MULTISPECIES: hypothetical protein [Glycomyces]|uniref:Uncharacterized protein n=1 Tax=Glycomyces lechevalierae TaxID=256034 RepID=A0A9X3PLZ2_9ACTN|nr:hypothetical protein [Glycomyces lechevalierae]MDA1386465.1 hypothetical protein [Glycomyces lechevalierae]MDR7338981.1 hypothetical protein [Glycomyces lechevalierae]
MNQARMRVLVQEPFYQHDHLGPGAPLRKISGQGEGDGYYDWAGRRLFLADGEPDPMCPGAYRYQHNPACCDLEAPDSDPRSPRYEPMHLRHKPGDTWIIDSNRPYDPYDPGPFGSPGWYKDERTGRHRRDETPDPLPAEGWVPPKGAWFPGTANWPEPEPPQDEATEVPTRFGQPRRDDDQRGDSQGRGGSDRPPPWGSRGRPVPSEPGEPEESQRPWGARTERPSPSPDADRPARRSWDRGGPGDAGWISGYSRNQSDHSDEQDNGERENDVRSGSDSTGEYRFSKLREDAFDRFMANSAQLRAAHFQPEKPYLRERALWVLRRLLWVLAIGLAPMPAPLNRHHRQPQPLAPHPIPAQPGPNDQGSERTRPAESAPAQLPGAALAAAVEGARAARKLITDRSTRTSTDLAAAVRDSANRTSATRPSAATHWRTQPRQTRPRPSPRPRTGSYMAGWEHAFDSSATFILTTGSASGAAA